MPGWVTNLFFSSRAAFLSLAPSSAKGYYATGFSSDCDIDAIESVQRRFTKRLPGLSCFTYHERLKRINIPSLELRRLYFDLIWCYKILFKHVDLEFDDFFEWALHPGIRGHRFKLYKKSSCIRIRQSFFSKRVVNVWNCLSAQIDFRKI